MLYSGGLEIASNELVLWVNDIDFSCQQGEIGPEIIEVINGMGIGNSIHGTMDRNSRNKINELYISPNQRIVFDYRLIADQGDAKKTPEPENPPEKGIIGDGLFDDEGRLLIETETKEGLENLVGIKASTIYVNYTECRIEGEKSYSVPCVLKRIMSATRSRLVKKKEDIIKKYNLSDERVEEIIAGKV